jgi:hypothetical protein
VCIPIAVTSSCDSSEIFPLGKMYSTVVSAKTQNSFSKNLMKFLKEVPSHSPFLGIVQGNVTRSILEDLNQLRITVFLVSISPAVQ